MPTIKKFAKLKRPAVLKIRNQLKRKPRPPGARNLVYEKLKANNSALAAALSKEKQETKYLFTHNLTLTSQLQELQVSLNRKDDIFEQILFNSKESLKMLVQATHCITNTISACQKVIGKHTSSTSRSSSSRCSIISKESKRQSVTAKSPARGVVQPMVSGHTITKPVINLSRINMPRIQTSPNLSDIEEGMTPESSPIRSETQVTPIPINQQNGFNGTGITHRRVERLLPERITVTPTRISDERRDLSERRSRRSSSRYSRRSSPKSPTLSSNFESRFSTSFNGTIRNPTVALHDVSKLMQNSQSVNVRTFLESTGNADTSTKLTMSPDNNTIKVQNNSSNDLDISDTNKHTSTVTKENSSSDSDDSTTYTFHPRKKKSTKTNKDDPLEGPSWLYGSSRVEESSGSTSVLENTVQPAIDPLFLLESSIRIQSQIESMARKKTLSTSAMELTHNNGTILQNSSNDYINRNSHDHNDEYDEDEVCRPINMSEYAAHAKTKNQKSDNYDDDPDLLRLSGNVTLTRGRHVAFDDDDFTMCINVKPSQSRVNMPFDVNELKLPQLEKPLIYVKPPEPEPEITATINIVPQNTNDILSRNESPLRNLDQSLAQDNDLVDIPTIQESMRMSELDPMILLADINQSLSMSEELVKKKEPLKRKRFNRIALASSSDSEPYHSPEIATKVKKKNTKKKDPSSAKVVLEKLDNSSKSFGESKSTLDSQSDSENSNASSKTVSRPRRRKAPTNLKEPSLGSKLRR